VEMRHGLLVLDGGAAGEGGRLLLLLERGRGLDLGLITRFRVRLTIGIYIYGVGYRV